jgi:hypothetical protein
MIPNYPPSGNPRAAFLRTLRNGKREERERESRRRRGMGKLIER